MSPILKIRLRACRVFCFAIPDLVLVCDELVVEDQLRDVVVEGPNLEPAHLHIQGEGVEGHRADECDPEIGVFFRALSPKL